MELKEYQERATATAEPRAYDLAYLVPGIVSEVGELLGQQAKAHWHGWTPERLQDAALLEYGDIAWLTAVLLKVNGRSNVLPLPRVRSVDTPTQQLVTIARDLHLAWSVDGFSSADREDWVAQEAVRMWRRLELHAEAVTGHPFDVALERNLAKLASRAERNVLRGAGDYR